MQEFKNTFQNGMNQDSNYVFQPDGTYVYMNNCSLISHDGNNYAVKDCLGNTLFLSINIPYDASYPALATPPMPIAFFSFPDRLIVFSTNDESDAGGYGEIGEIKYLPYGEGVKPFPESGQLNSGYTSLYHHLSLNFSRMHKIEGYTFPENDSIQRIYWTDFNNEPRVINLADTAFSTTYASGSLVNGTEYMVCQGVVEYPVASGNKYGPGLTLGNVFTAGATANYTATSGTAPTPRVIEYFPYELLSWTPDWTPGEMKFKEYGDGNVLCGKKMFFHRLTTSDGVYTTPWSYGTFPVDVLDKTGTFDPGGYLDYHGAGTPTITVNSGRSVVMTISSIDQKYGLIEVCVAEFDQIIDTPRQVVTFIKEAITSSSMDFEYTGVSIGSVAIGEITTFSTTINKCKSLTTNKNYNIPAHIIEREEIEIDLSSVSLSSFEYPLFLTRAASVCSSSQGKELPTAIHGNPLIAEIYQDTRWLVISGGTVNYNGNVANGGVPYSAGQVFVGVAGGGNWSVASGTPVIRPCATLNRYNNGSSRVENAIPLAIGFWDYTEPVVQNHCTGYFSNETYRYGVECLDKKGKPYYVIPLPNDFTFPSLNDKGGIVTKATSGGTDYYSLNPSGLKIDNLFIPDTVLDQISGFRIVRSKRINPKVITQGLVTQTVVNVGVALYTAAFNPPGFSSFHVSNVDFIMLSPDINCGTPLKTEVGVIGQTLEEACWIGPVLNAGEPSKFISNSDFVDCRLLEPLAADSDSPRSTTIFYWDQVEDGESTTVYNNTVTYYNTTIIDGVGPSPSTACIGGGPYSLANFVAKGGLKNVFGVNTEFTMYGGAVNYGQNTGTWQNASDARKILMNITNPSGGTYGKVEDTLYISTGHYQPITTAVRTATAATVGGITGSLFDGIEVMGGDCFTCYTDYGYSLWDNDFAANTYSYAWYFPCECNANYTLRKGRRVTQDGMYYTGAAAGNKIVYLDPSSATKFEGFQYNQGYSSEGQSFQYPSKPLNFINDNQFKIRARYAGPKVIGETIDTFRVFNTLDYADLPVQGGQINKISAREGRITIWQDKQTVSVPILERQILSGLPGASTTIGTGGVMDRSDIISSYHGTQHQWSVIETEFGYVWFDMRHKAFVEFSDGILEISQILGMKSFFSEVFVEAVGDAYSVITNDTDNLINPPDYNDSCDRPLLFTGITGVYDPKFKWTLMTFKFKRRTGDVEFTNYDFTIAYNHIKKQFSHFTDWTPAIAHSHNGLLLSANNPKNIQKPYVFGMTSRAYALGDVIDGQDNSEYITTTASPVMAFALPPSASYFTKINTTNQIWVHYQPSAFGQSTAPDYKYSSIFGRIVNQVISFIVNPQTGNPVSVLAIEQNGNNINVTDVETEAFTESGIITAADNSIRSTDSNYRTTWDSINSNLPLYRDSARITARYLKITLTKKNWTTNPTVLAKSVKILRWVKSLFIEKR